MNPFVVALFACLTLFTSAIAKEASSQGAPSAPPAVSVDVFTVTAPKEETLVFTYPAKTISPQSVVVKARTNGIVQHKFFTEGESVKADTVLYQLEKESYEAAFNLAKANVNALEVQVHKTRKEWDRAKALFDNNASSEQDKDTAYFAHETAKASLASAQAALQTATINLNRTTIKAPIGGIVGMKQVDVGALVTEGTPLVEITTTDPLHVEFSIPDVDIMKQKYRIKNGQWSKPAQGKLHASLQVAQQPYPELGVVDFLDNTLNPKTGSLKARATFKNPSNTLLPNQFVTLNLLGLTRNAVIKIPQKAVLQNPLGTVVFVVEEGKAVVKPVKIGETSEGHFIIESGLKENDRVIVNNFFRIKNGTAVKIDKTINEAH